MHTPRGHQPAEPAPARVTLVPVAVILACAVGGAGTLWSVRDQLPARIVRHWGADGRPDGYATLNEMLATGVAFTLLMPLAMLGLGLAMRQARVLGPVAGGLAAFLAIVLFGGAFTQRGIADGSGIAVSPPLWLGYGAGLAVGVLLWAHPFSRRPTPGASPGRAGPFGCGEGSSSSPSAAFSWPQAWRPGSPPGPSPCGCRPRRSSP